MPFDRTALDRPNLDAWGLPQSPSARRETDDILARATHGEPETSDSYRRIEDQLRNVGRRLDNAERSQSESHRAMSQATTEINVASREQTQAFEQLGTQVLGLSERLERLERHVAQDPLKDAVKGLHQGLSRLADQIGQTASHSATQISTVAGNLEQLAARLGQARSEAESATRALEGRMASAESTLGQANVLIEKADTAAKALEVRVAAAEGALENATNRLDQSQEKIDAQAGIRAHDLAELQKWEANHLGSLERIEDRIARLENKGPDLAIERRLDNIEQALAGVVSRLEQSDPIAALADTLRQVNQRLDSVEKSHFEMLAELRASLGHAPQPAPVIVAPSFNPAPEAPPVFEAPKFEPPAAEAPAELPPAAPMVEPEAAAAAFDEPIFKPEASKAEPFAAEAAEPLFEEPAPMDAPLEEGFAPRASAFSVDATEEGAFPAASFGEDAFANQFEMPQDFADAMAQSAPAGDNFLSAARRSAQAAADAEAQRPVRGLSWTRSEFAGEEKPKSRNLIILAVGFVTLLAVAVGLMLNNRGSRTTPAAKPQTAKSAVAKTPAPKPQTSAVAPLQGPQKQPAENSATAPATSVPTTLALVPPSMIKPVPKTEPQKSAAPTAAIAPAKATPSKTSSVDKVAAAANQGNPTAETIIGLRYLDGQGITADPIQALKWLQKAADAGQAVAQYRLGTMYERGQGVAASPTLAAKWYLAAANQGNRKAMHNLAVSYAEGATGKKDMAESARWFSKAAALGLSDSQFNLAVLYERGDGVPQSLIDAYKWYSIAAAAGDAESRTRMGVLQTQLSEADRAAATRAAQTFRVLPLNRIANVPPEAADIASN